MTPFVTIIVSCFSLSIIVSITVASEETNQTDIIPTCDLSTEILVNNTQTCGSDYCPSSECQDQSCDTSEESRPLCKCRFNYRRDENNTCIPTRSCPPFSCSGDNEEFNPCPPLCPTDSCSQATPDGRCPTLFGTIGIILPCTPKCRCIKNYWRKNGVCVPYKECLASEETNQTDVTPTCDLPNEILVNNTQTCGSDFCPSSEGLDQSCDTSEESRPLCKCRFNYRRDENNTCIPTRSCPPFPCSGDNEEFNPCPPLCPNDSCSQATPDGRCPTLFGKIGITLPCTPKCRCIKNYWRKNGICVPYKECLASEETNQTDVTPTCDLSNEILVNNTRTCGSDFCPSSECQDQSCDTSEESRPLCKCRFNYRRDENNTCIPTRSCPPFPCSGDNEEFNPCPPLCPTDSCSQATPDGRCPALFGRIGIILPCTPKCRCIKNYWRKNGVCVPYKECPRAKNIDLYNFTVSQPSLEIVSQNDSYITLKINDLSDDSQ